MRDEVIIDELRHEVVDPERAWVEAIVYVEEEHRAGIRWRFRGAHNCNEKERKRCSVLVAIFKFSLKDCIIFLPTVEEWVGLMQLCAIRCTT